MSQVPSNNQEIISVSDINNLAKGLLEKDLSNVWIQGEISSFTAHGSGHWYFTIKDKKSSLSCVMFKFENQSVLFDPKIGDELILNGNISIYAPSGRYQFNVKHIEVFGEGALLKAFEDLKIKLENDGLFDQSRKKLIPKLPLAVAVITSETGAVFQDIINVLRRRSPYLKLTLVESQVQGRTADKEIVKAIRRANEVEDFDVIILARGGGSIEDLWCFNMESVAREISKSQLPIISAIGHETDFTICDFVSDLRAPTPSAAAEIISESYVEKLSELTEISNLIGAYFENILSKYENKLKIIQKSLINPKTKILQNNQKLDEFENLLKIKINEKLTKLKNGITLSKSELLNFNPMQTVLIHDEELKSNRKILLKIMSSFIELKKEKFSRLVGEMNSLSPLNVLSRGYSITKNKKTDKIIRNQNDVSPGDVITTKVSEALFDSKVIKN